MIFGQNELDNNHHHSIVRRAEHGVWVGLRAAGALQPKSVVFDDEQEVFNVYHDDMMLRWQYDSMKIIWI